MDLRVAPFPIWIRSHFHLNWDFLILISQPPPPILIFTLISSIFREAAISSHIDLLDPTYVHLVECRRGWSGIGPRRGPRPIRTATPAVVASTRTQIIHLFALWRRIQQSEQLNSPRKTQARPAIGGRRQDAIRVCKVR